VTQIRIALFRALGAGIAIAVMEMLARLSGEPMVRVPFVTSIVLAMALPDSGPAQPRAIVGGHMLSAASGYLAIWLFGQGDTAAAIAVGLSTFAMLASRMLHPPAGIDGFLIATYALPLDWIVSPVLVGALLLSGFALIWRTLEARLFRPNERAAAPQLWSLERIRQLARGRR